MYIHTNTAARVTVIMLLIVFYFPFCAHPQHGPALALEQYRKQCDLLLREGGVWRTVNTDYEPGKEGSPSYFGYVFSRGVNANTILLTTRGYLPGLSQWVTYRDCVYTWDYKKGKPVFYGTGTDGVLLAGEVEKLAENEWTLQFRVISAGGKEELKKEVQQFKNDGLVTGSYTQKAGKWQVDGNRLWNRLEQPSGSLAFMSARDGNFEIYSMDVKGENLKNLSCNKASDYWCSWFAAGDGRFAFYSNREGNDDIYIMDAGGKKAVNISNHSAGDRIPNVSPDGKRILFLSDRDHKNGEIYLMDIDGKNLKRLTDNAYFEDSPGWSPDGRRVIFTRELKDTTPNAVGNGEIFIMNIDGTNETRLTDRPGYDGGACFSPDGSRIAFYGKTADGNYELFLMNADGTGVVNLSEDPLEDYSPAWSPDGKWIAYTKGDSKNYDAWLIHLETKIKTRLTTHPKRDESPVWIPVGK